MSHFLILFNRSLDALTSFSFSRKFSSWSLIFFMWSGCNSSSVSYSSGTFLMIKNKNEIAYNLNTVTPKSVNLISRNSRNLKINQRTLHIETLNKFAFFRFGNRLVTWYHTNMQGISLIAFESRSIIQQPFVVMLKVKTDKEGKWT